MNNLVEILNDQVVTYKKPFLGICIGMQILADFGYENKKTKGLSWINGDVKCLKNFVDSAQNLKIPHMGWNELKIENNSKVFKNIVNKNHAYFIHSYEFIPKDKKNISLTTNYGKDVIAAVSLENIYGSQFHPEKSQNTGIKILTNFLNL